MFGIEFYPTPENVIHDMMNGEEIEGKRFLEPSAGHGNIVKYLLNNGALSVIACEKDEDLRQILQNKCNILENDFFNVKSEQVSHIDHIVMNPPFSNADAHILHAYDIAPEGCKITALCNSNTIKNDYSESRKRLSIIIKESGSSFSLGACFDTADRKTEVEISLIKIQKPGGGYNMEFDGFFMDDDDTEKQENALMPYNVVRDLVNRYVEAVKIFDEQLKAAEKMHNMTAGFFSCNIGMSISNAQQPITRSEFKKEMQKNGWMFIFDKMNMKKYATKGLKEDINKFVETQTQIPFTMKNIYRMLEIVIGTQSQRMDKALIEVFERVTSYHNDNKFGLEGWKTNSHYLLNRRFIMPNISQVDYYGGITTNYSSNFEMVEDFVKALCYITGDNYDNQIELYQFMNNRYFLVKDDVYVVDSSYNNIKKCWRKNETPVVDFNKHPNCKIIENKLEWGKWFDWGYFRVRFYKKGTCHFEFISEDIWGKFNQHVSRIKGYPIPEKVNKPKESKTHQTVTTKPIILETIEI